MHVMHVDACAFLHVMDDMHHIHILAYMHLIHMRTRIGRMCIIDIPMHAYDASVLHATM